MLKSNITKSRSGHYTATLTDERRIRYSQGKLASVAHARMALDEMRAKIEAGDLSDMRA